MVGTEREGAIAQSVKRFSGTGAIVADSRSETQMSLFELSLKRSKLSDLGECRLKLVAKTTVLCRRGR